MLMNRSTANAVVDAVAFAAFVFLAATGVLIRYVLPPGSGHISSLWGMDRHEWGQIHFWIAVALFAVLAFHLLLHWRWIVCTIQGRPREGSGGRLTLALLAILALVGLAASPFFVAVEHNGQPPHKMRSEKLQEDQVSTIDGSMTLLEIERRTGVPSAAIIKELGLPNDLPTDERLGKLRKQYGFDVHRVREIVQKHLDQKNHD